jgi:hypothetical protein
MGGCIDWTALPIVSEILGIEDVELLLDRLVTIREFKDRG